MTRTSLVVRVVGAVAAFLLLSGIGTLYVTALVKDPPAKARPQVDAANRRCPTMPALRPVALQPKGNVLTFVDLGPRLITVTHHNTVIGPYHRNARQIIDVMRTWRGSPEMALDTVRRYRIDYVLICPNLSESTVYRAEAPNGFYAQLAMGRAPEWLVPVRLPRDSPYRMWRVIRR